MKHLRILLTCEDYFPHIGGAEVCIYNLRSQLTMRGHTVSVFTNTTEKTNDENGVTRLLWAFSPLGLWRTVHLLWRLIGKADIVHSTYSFRLACICAVIAKTRGKPLLLTQQGRGIVPETNPHMLGRIFFRICQEVSMKLATHITSTSDEITDLTAAFVPHSKITLISNGYDAEMFTPRSDIPVPPEFVQCADGVRKFLTVRRLVPKNGIHILVQALALVKERRTDFHYFAIGEGRTEMYVRSLIESLGLSEHVTLLGKRTNDTLLAYYQHADLVLIPSSAEARSIACIEAMGMAKPIIASRVGGLIDLLGKDSAFGELVSIYDSEACTYDPPSTLPRERLQPLADAIISFLEAPDSLVARGKAAREKVLKEYSWHVITDQYVQQYDKLVSSSTIHS